MIIRKMTENDCTEIGALYAAAWKKGYEGLLPKLFLDELSPQKYEERAPMNGFLDNGSFVISDGQTIFGHCHARAADEEKMRGWGEIHTLYVHPNHWHKGYGTELIKYGTNWLRSQGFNDIYLYALIGNERAIKLYKKLGFTPNGDTLDCIIAGETVTDIRLIKHF